MTRHDPLTQLDPAVLAALNDGQQRQAQAARSPAARAKVRRDKERNGQRLRALDLTPEVFDQLRGLAEHEGVSMSNLATFLIQHGLNRVQRGELDLHAHKEIARSLRFDFRLRLPAPEAPPADGWGKT